MAEIQKRQQRLDPFQAISTYEKMIADFHEEVDEGEIEKRLDAIEDDEERKSEIYENQEVVDFFGELTHTMSMLRYTIYTSRIDEWEGISGFMSLMRAVFSEAFYQDWMMSQTRRAIKMGHGAFLVLITSTKCATRIEANPDTC